MDIDNLDKFEGDFLMKFKIVKKESFLTFGNSNTFNTFNFNTFNFLYLT